MSDQDSRRYSWPEVIVDDETFRDSIQRLSKTLFKRASEETNHFGWVASMEPGQSLSEHLDKQYENFISSLEPEDDVKHEELTPKKP